MHQQENNWGAEIKVYVTSMYYVWIQNNNLRKYIVDIFHEF